MYKKQSIEIKNFKHFMDLCVFVIHFINKIVLNPLSVKVYGLLEIVHGKAVFCRNPVEKRTHLRKYYPFFVFICARRHKLYTVVYTPGLAAGVFLPGIIFFFLNRYAYTCEV